MRNPRAAATSGASVARSRAHGRSTLQVTVKGKNLAVPAGAREQAISKLSKVRQIFDHFLDMEVVFAEDRNPRIGDRIHCEVTLHARGRTIRASAAAPDLTTAIDRAEAKLLRQARKLKTRALDRSRPAGVPDRGELAGTVGPDGPSLID